MCIVYVFIGFVVNLYHPNIEPKVSLVLVPGQQYNLNPTFNVPFHSDTIFSFGFICHSIGTNLTHLMFIITWKVSISYDIPETYLSWRIFL